MRRRSRVRRRARSACSHEICCATRLPRKAAARPGSATHARRAVKMRTISILLVLALAASPVAAQERQPSVASSDTGRGPLFWSGLVLGVAGVTTAVLGTTAYRVED